jgi:hypothetical protein
VQYFTALITAYRDLTTGQTALSCLSDADPADRARVTANWLADARGAAGQAPAPAPA